MVDTVIGTEDARARSIPQVERVLLAARGSFAGLAAARWLIARSRTQPLAVQVSVAPDALPSVDHDGPDPAAAAQRVQDYLDLVEPGIESAIALLSADREADVLDATLETDLLVLATTVADPSRSPTPSRRAPHAGSFASRVAMQAGCATVIVPAGLDPERGPRRRGRRQRRGRVRGARPGGRRGAAAGAALVLLRASQPAAVGRPLGRGRPRRGVRRQPRQPEPRGRAN